MAAGSAGRVAMDGQHTVDWDDSPTIYQAVTVSHGHLLRYRQVWRADGYSLGEMLYSLPLAPGQKKLVSVLDWSRREDTRRAERTSEEEELHAFLERDRDVAEIVDSHLRETSAGGSSANTWAGGGGIGIGAIGTGFGVFAGVAGGGGGSSSRSWQDSGRTYSSEAMQSIRDTTLQGASAVRSTRSSVIQTDHQAERARAPAEVVGADQPEGGPAVTPAGARLPSWWACIHACGRRTTPMTDPLNNALKEAFKNSLTKATEHHPRDVRFNGAATLAVLLDSGLCEGLLAANREKVEQIALSLMQNVGLMALDREVPDTVQVANLATRLLKHLV